jgi:hypothetical protein
MTEGQIERGADGNLRWVTTEGKVLREHLVNGVSVKFKSQSMEYFSELDVEFLNLEEPRSRSVRSPDFEECFFCQLSPLSTPEYMSPVYTMSRSLKKLDDFGLKIYKSSAHLGSDNRCSQEVRSVDMAGDYDPALVIHFSLSQKLFEQLKADFAIGLINQLELHCSSIDGIYEPFLGSHKQDYLVNTSSNDLPRCGFVNFLTIRSSKH